MTSQIELNKWDSFIYKAVVQILKDHLRDFKGKTKNYLDVKSIIILQAYLICKSHWWNYVFC